MTIKVQGLIIAQRSIGEQDKILTLLTKQYGMIEASIKNSKTKKFRNVSLFSYMDFILYKGRTTYFINSAELIESFYALRLDVEKLALAGYFCELTHSLSVTQENAWVCLRLLLNTLYMLAENKKENTYLKAIFELRICSITGFMPNLIGCSKCNEYEKETMFFFPMQGNLICGDCLRNKAIDDTIRKFPLHPSILVAMRYIIYSEPNKIYNFSIDNGALKQLNIITEYYMMAHLERNFNALIMYKELTGGLYGNQAAT